MRKLAIVLSLSLLAGAAVPAQASHSATGFATLDRCETYLDRRRDLLDAGRAKGWAGVKYLFDGAYCEERDGRYFAVFPF
jgi:hypothetical protein